MAWVCEFTNVTVASDCVSCAFGAFDCACVSVESSDADGCSG